MTQKQKKEMRQRASTRQLMGIKELTDYGVKTLNGEFVVYLIRPDNLSVMPEETVRNRVLSLTNLLRASQELYMVALDSRESFQHNRDWYQERIEQEQLPAVRELLRKDIAHLDKIQTGTASSSQDIKRVLAVYYQQDAFTDDFKNYDGEGMVKEHEAAEEENR